MGFKRKWNPSKTQIHAFISEMDEIEKFCIDNNISASKNNDSYYFTINGQKYRVSNHTVKASNAGAYDDMGQKVREKYHPGGEEKDTIYITAGKTRIIEIYNDLKMGYVLDRRGRRKK